MIEPPLSHQRGAFVERVLIAAAITGGVVLLWVLRDLVILVLGAIVVAVLLTVAAESVTKLTSFGRRAALAVVLTLLLLATGGLAFLFGAQVDAQFTELGRKIPEGWSDVKAAAQANPLGRQLLSAGSDGTLVARMSGLVVGLGTALLDLMLLVVGAVFFAAQPRQYRDGFLKLFPAAWRGALGEAVDDSGRALRLWLRAQLISVVIVGALTWAGLALAGVPAALALGLVAAALEIIPYVGPILSAIPGVLLAVAVAPETALWALGVYVAVQQLEGNVIQPLVQKQVVTLPPAVTLFGMVAAGLMFGFLGVMFAAPASVVAYVFLKRLYVRELLETATSVPGEVVAAAPTRPPAGSP